MGLTNEKLASLIKKELALIINVSIRNNKIGFINVTEVKLTNDLSFANVYYVILNNQPEFLSLAAEIIEKNKSTIRMLLAKKIRNIRKIPELVFIYDTSLEYGNHIDNILKGINK
ncbi:Ribosome-binding factor A [Candidatus Phytoplasma mali]|uniref:Ribosome-binding factor A n=1 Tax=Phytoplasma mali (strain AT) TaxID=482235 RepID=RBFA_PHYMT|nr:30S ribosome-binding factor RbfA [Candidatus Phytoplasma mali]B3QZW6.1 RecName: Full=Ribosome-binding factor A [Candidatus Phytoplasma mali AT]CAP18503.1 Ribosome-binding factor A [Candidatus Phytoplasma mali]